MRIELLWWEGCPSTPAARELVERVLAEEGAGSVPVELRRVQTDEQAEREGFHGSPTIRIDGRDVQPPPEGEPAALACRIYRLRDGRISPTPDPEDVRDAVRRALR